MVLDTGTILSTAPTNLNDTVLLDIMSLPRDNGSNDLSRTQPHAGRLALARVRLLRLRDSRLQAHALQRWVVFQRGRARAACALAFAAAALYLVVGCADDRGAGELALAGCLVEGEGFLGAENGLEGEAT